MAMSTPLESTATLLIRAKAGDSLAREKLCEQYLPMLMRWAHGRLPEHARDLAMTEDMVQMALLKALQKLDGFTPKREGSFLAYLRTILLNDIRNEIRRVAQQRQYLNTPVSEELSDPHGSVLQQAVGADIVERYEAGLMALTEKAREAVILRVEFGMSFPEIASAMLIKNDNAARMLVTRSLVKLAERMETSNGA